MVYNGFVWFTHGLIWFIQGFMRLCKLLIGCYRFMHGFVKECMCCLFVMFLKYVFSEIKSGFGLSYTPYLSKLVNDISLGNLTYFNRINERSAFAVSLRYFSLGEIEDALFSYR